MASPSSVVPAPAAHCGRDAGTARDGRRIRVGRYEQRLADARQQQKDPAWVTGYRATRSKVERKLGHLMARKHGGRRARMRCPVKIDADFTLLAVGHNLAASPCSSPLQNNQMDRGHRLRGPGRRPSCPPASQERPRPHARTPAPVHDCHHHRPRIASDDLSAGNPRGLLEQNEPLHTSHLACPKTLARRPRDSRLVSHHIFLFSSRCRRICTPQDQSGSETVPKPIPTNPPGGHREFPRPGRTPARCRCRRQACTSRRHDRRRRCRPDHDHAQRPVL